MLPIGNTKQKTVKYIGIHRSRLREDESIQLKERIIVSRSPRAAGIYYSI